MKTKLVLALFSLFGTAAYANTAHDLLERAIDCSDLACVKQVLVEANRNLQANYDWLENKSTRAHDDLHASEVAWLAERSRACEGADPDQISRLGYESVRCLIRQTVVRADELAIIIEGDRK